MVKIYVQLGLHFTIHIQTPQKTEVLSIMQRYLVVVVAVNFVDVVVASAVFGKTILQYLEIDIPRTLSPSFCQ